MAIHKITLSKIIDGVIEYFYPKTTADCVEYTSSQSVLDKLEELDGGSSDLYDITIRLQEAVEQAQESADNAQSTADEALNAANKAQETADANSESITNIQIEITNLSEAVNNAQSTADEALSTAESNSSSITNIQAVIDVIKDTADEALDTANKAQSSADSNVYTSGTGISISSSNVINHSNNVTAGTASGSATGSLSYGGTFNVPTVSYDAQGHIIGSGTTTMTMPSISDSTSSTSSSTAASSSAVKAAMDAASAAQSAAEAAQAAAEKAQETADAAEGTAEGISYSAGTGLSLSGTTFNHSNSITAGTVSGDSSKTLSYGGTFKVPSVTYDAQGHITSTTTTTMTMPAEVTSVSTAEKLGSSTVGSGTKPIYLSSGTATASTSTVGSSSTPVYLNAGTITACSGITASSADTATTAEKLGSSTVGSGIKPIYLSSGTATASSSTVGSSSTPVYLNSGTITACSSITASSADTATTAEKLGTSTVGSGTKPIYLSSGTATASSSTVGSSSNPVYLNAGTITACSSISASTLGSSTVGSGTKPIYLSSGTATASSSTVGSSSIPVYLNAGTITACTNIETSSNTCYYGTCSTAASTAAKTATIDGFSLITGVTIIIKFTYGNGAESPTLNISNTGNIDIYTYDTILSGLRSFPDNSIVQFVYDGTCWLIVSMIDGYNCIASASNSHAEGNQTTASGSNSHTEGYKTIASGSYGSHAEGNQTTASGNYSHAEGGYNTASEECSHVEGGYTTASGIGSHAEGYYTIASGMEAHVEGAMTTTYIATTASGQGSHAEGFGTTASGECSHAEGGWYAISDSNDRYNTASAYASHAEGSCTTASAEDSHAEGFWTTANNFGMHAGGKFNKLSSSTASGYASNTGDVFVLGNGTGSSSLSNAFRVTYAGAVYGLSSFNSSGADYAEFIKPWADGNPDEEDRVGYFVTVKDGMLYKASSGDYIAGITSGNPSIVGNSDEDYYHKYERDEFNRIIWEDTTITKNDKDESTEELEINTTTTSTIQKDDENGIKESNMQIELSAGKPMPCYTDYGDTDSITCSTMKISEDYDNTLQDIYVERKDRPEWDYVGMIGVLPVRDDGTCEAGGFAKCGGDGIATYADSWTIGTYYVIERITDSVINVIFK